MRWLSVFPHTYMIASESDNLPHKRNRRAGRAHKGNPPQKRTPLVVPHNKLDIENSNFLAAAPLEHSLRHNTALICATTGGDGEACASAHAGKAVMDVVEPRE